MHGNDMQNETARILRHVDLGSHPTSLSNRRSSSVVRRARQIPASIALSLLSHSISLFPVAFSFSVSSSSTERPPQLDANLRPPLLLRRAEARSASELPTPTPTAAADPAPSTLDQQPDSLLRPDPKSHATEPASLFSSFSARRTPDPTRTSSQNTFPSHHFSVQTDRAPTTLPNSLLDNNNRALHRTPPTSGVFFLLSDELPRQQPSFLHFLSSFLAVGSDSFTLLAGKISGQPR